MEAYFLEVAHLALRFFHIVAAMAWIGASFYFVWLDNNLQKPPPEKRAKGIRGDLWAIHGGGFYEVAKYRNGPETMPKTLHWFKWEAYSTWFSGFLLLTLVYYVSADAYLLDTSKSTLSSQQAIGVSVASLLMGWFVYDGLCRTALVNHGRAFTATCVLLLSLWAYGLDQVLADRAAYIHVGALIGTCMAANVWRVIMPSQRYMVAEITAGREPDPQPGLNRSSHNNYATLPVIFIMMSNHFAFTYSHSHGWLVLTALIVIGMWIRHYFNLKNQGMKKPQVLISGCSAFVVLMLAMAPWPEESLDKAPLSKIPLNKTPEAYSSNGIIKRAEASIHTVSVTTDNETAWKILETHCQECHSATPRSEMFSVAPNGFIVDSLEQAKANRDPIYARTVLSKDMPLANLTKMTQEERTTLAQWLDDL